MRRAFLLRTRHDRSADARLLARWLVGEEQEGESRPQSCRRIGGVTGTTSNGQRRHLSPSGHAHGEPASQRRNTDQQHVDDDVHRAYVRQDG
jgi:hypothetical protein